MAKFTWSGSQDTNWFNPNNWNPAIVPTPGATVVIPTGLTNYPVVPSGNAITLNQDISLGGPLTLASTGQATDLVINGGVVRKFSGGGSLILSDNANNRIYSNQSGTVLENVNDTIAGAGQIYANSGLSILNDAAGVINANATDNQLDINNIYLTNNGLVEATGAAGLFLDTDTLDQSSGAGVLSANGGNVYLNRTTILGGTLQTASGLIETAGNVNTLDGTGTHAITIATGSTVQINDGNNLTITGTFNNKGVIKLASGQDGVHFDATDLIVNGSITDKLQGGGAIQLSDSANNRIYSNNGATILENVDNTITGAGQIYPNSGLSILNDAAGVINASATNNQLDINNIYLTNNGLVEATGAAGLFLDTDTLDQSTGAGVLSANGGNVYLNRMTILGGTLQTPSGLIETGGNVSVLDGTGTHPITIATGSTVQINDGNNLTITGVINNKGVIKLASGQDGVHFDNTDLIVNGSITDKLQGGGTIQLSDSAANRIYSSNANTVLENVDDTITGAGQIFANNGLSIRNDTSGVINASAAHNQLDINNIYVTNNGLVEATGAAGLFLDTDTLDQSTGAGVLSANGGNVYLNRTTILGGTLQTPSGLIETAGNVSVLDGTGTHAITLAAGSTIQINDGNNLTITGVINNKGVIKLVSGQDGVHFDSTDLIVNGAITDKLQGGGVLQLSDSANNRIYTTSGGTVLENVNDTITGAGQIFTNNGLSILNDASGVINASAAINALNINNIVVNNAGLVEATSTGGLALNSMTLNNAGGTLSAAGGIVNLNASGIVGGTLSSSGVGRIQTSGNSSLLNGVTVAAGGSVWVSDGNNLSITGTITNNGVIFLRSGQNGVNFDNTDLLIQGGGTVTLTGGGTVQLVAGGANRIFSNQGGTILDNINNKIVGSGQIFANSGLSITNEATGSISASNTAQTLAITSIAVTNKGSISATNDATLTLNSVTLSQSGAGLLWAFQGNIFFNASHISGGAIASGGGYVVATNGNSTLLDGSSSALSIIAGSTVRVSDGTNLSLTGTIANAGTLFVDSGQDGVHFDNTDLLIQGAVNLTGGGTLLLSNSTNNRIFTNTGGSVLTNTNNTIIGGGQIFANSGLSIVNAAAGVIEAGVGESLNVSVAIANSGVLEGNGGALSVSGPVTGAGVGKVANGGSVTFSGSTALSSVVFATPYAGTITLPFGVTPTVTGFAPGDTLLFNSSQPVTSLSYNAGVLSFLNGVTTVESFTLNGSYTTSDFQLTTGGAGVYGVTDQGDQWQGGTGPWAAGPWREGLPGAANDAVISSGAPTVAASIGTVRSLSVLGAGSVDFAGVGGNAVSGAVYDASSFGLDSGSGEGGASLSAGSVTVAPGGLLTIGNASLSGSDQLTAGSIVNNGTIALVGAGTNQALFNVTGAAGFGSAGVVGGNVSLTGNSAVEFGSGGLQTIATGASLSLTGASAFVELAGHLGANSALTGLRSINGALSLEGGAVVAPTGTLYDSGVLNVDDVGPGGTVVTLPTLYVTGALNIGNAGMTVADTVNVTTLHGVGAITLAGGASAQALLNVNAAAGFDSPAGRLFGALSLSGHSALQFASGAITAIDGSGSLRLQGANAFVQVKTTPNANSALTTLGLDAGTLSLENGAHLADSSALNNTGVITLDALLGEGGSSLSETLGLTNAKTLTVGNATLSAATTVSANSLANTGTLAATGSAGFQALINVAGAAGFGTTGVLTGSVTLSGNAQIKFASGGVTTIAAGGVLDLVGSAALIQNNLSGANSGLKTLSTVAGALTLDSQVTIASTSALTNSSVISIDATAGEGGSQLTTTGALTNSGSVTLGNASLSASDLVKAASLNNTGTLTLIGGASNQALVNIGSAAGFGSAAVLTGNVSLAGTAAIQFASSSLTTVAAGSKLTITGGSAFVETGATNSNSALSTLSVDNGAIALHGGVQIASLRALTVATGAQLSIDASAGEGDSNVTFVGGLANAGALTLGNATLAASDLLQATSLANTGTLSLAGGAAQALLNVNHAAANLSGTVTLTNDAAIAFTSGSLTNILAGASLTLDGPNAYIEDGAANANNALNNLSFLSGAFNLFNGGSVSTVGLTNTGQIQVEATRGIGLNTSMSFSGLLKNTGSFTMLAATSTQANISVSAMSLYNTGSISLANGNGSPNATLLTIAGAAGFGTANFVTGAVTIGADSAISFGSGGITSIAKGATLELAATNGFLEIGASNSNSALTGLSAVAGTLQIDNGSAIATTASLNNAGTINIDTASGGGGSLSTTGGLTNSGALNIGAGYNLAASAEVSAASLNNTGSITLSGGAVTQALLRINGAAGFGSAGVFKGVATLYNDAAIQFNSGAITSVAAGSALRLVTGAAELEVGASNPTNALATLGTIAGTLELDNGAGFADSAALSITGGLFLDSFAGEGGSGMSNTNVINNSGTLNLGNTSSTAGTNASAASLLNTGSINLTGNGSNHFAELNVTGTLTNNGAIYAISDQESISGAVAGVGTFDIWNNANLSFAAAVGAGQSVTFDTAGTLGVNATGNVFQAAIAGFGSGDAIQVSNFAGLGASRSYLDNGNHTGVLTISNNGVNTQLDFAGDYTTANFSVTGTATTATLGFV